MLLSIFLLRRRKIMPYDKLQKKVNNEEIGIFHKSFEIAILLKGLDGIFEIIGGVLLIFLTPNRLNKLIALLTQHELSEDPKDVIANFAIGLGSHFSLSSQHFGVFYLVSHGLIKLILITMLWKRKTWAYPLTVVSLLLFALYQVYRCTSSFSVFLVALTIFDIIMIVLTLIEYRNIKLNLKRYK